MRVAARHNLEDRPQHKTSSPHSRLLIMSLSFVASSVQTGTSDGNYEETPIENTETAAVNRQNSHKPLFEQLRANQEEEEAKQDEMQRQMMRGTRALDEEDVAHLDALERQRQERERAIHLQTHDEVAAFRAARLEQQQVLLEEDDHEEDEGHDRNEAAVSKTPAAPASAPLKPKFIVKKRRKRTPSDEDAESQKKQKKENATKAKNDEKAKEKQEDEKKPVKDDTKGLGGLLGGYGSSDEDSD